MAKPRAVSGKVVMVGLGGASKLRIKSVDEEYFGKKPEPMPVDETVREVLVRVPYAANIDFLGKRVHVVTAEPGPNAKRTVYCRRGSDYILMPAPLAKESKADDGPSGQVTIERIDDEDDHSEDELYLVRVRKKRPE